MKQKKLLILMLARTLLLAGFGTFAALAEGPGLDSPVVIYSTTACSAGTPAGWTCPTSVTRSGNKTTCTAKAVSPGGKYDIAMYEAEPSDTRWRALHVGSTYYGLEIVLDLSPHTCPNFISSAVKFTYSGTAKPTLCNWRFCANGNCIK